MVIPRRPCRSRRAAGLTLLELLVALLLASMVMAMAAGAVRAAVRAVGDVTVDRQRGGREDRVRALIASQMAWLSLNEARAPVRFVARKLTLDAETMCTLAAPHRREHATARWRFVERPSESGVFDLWYAEASSRTASERPPDETAAEAMRADAESLSGDLDVRFARAVIRSLRDPSIAYFHAPGGVGGAQGVWTDDWNQPGLPRAMRIAFTTDQGVRTSWVIPVAVTF